MPEPMPEFGPAGLGLITAAPLTDPLTGNELIKSAAPSFKGAVFLFFSYFFLRHQIQLMPKVVMIYTYLFIFFLFTMY